MNEKDKNDMDVIMEILVELNQTDMSIMRISAETLKARNDLDKQEKAPA